MLPVSPNEPKERTTGATDAQIELMAKRFHNLGQTDPYDYHDWDEIGRNEKAAVRDWVEDIISVACPVGMVIAPAADVLTSEMRKDITDIYCLVASGSCLAEIGIAAHKAETTLRAIAAGGAK